MSEDELSELVAGPALGTMLEGRYKLIGHLGEGGVGWVYRAKHVRLGTDVAVKMLQAPYEQHDMLRPRFEREAKVLAELRHPHIVTLTDYSVDGEGRPYLVMELLEGRTLGELIDEGTVAEPRARRILQQILDALVYAHERGFAHRDLKPTNVFLVELPTERDHVKVLDFGFVKFLGSEPSTRADLTRSGIAFGTPSYMCPEQATGGETSSRGDLYSVGVMFFEMLAGRRPFVGEIPDVIRQHLTEPVPRLSVGGAQLSASRELRHFFDRAMAKDPSDRFQSAVEMREALDALPSPSCEAVDSVDSIRKTVPGNRRAQVRRDELTRPATPAVTRSRRRRGGTLAFALSAVALAAVGVTAWLLMNPAESAQVAGDGGPVAPSAEVGASEEPDEPTAGGGGGEQPADLDFTDALESPEAPPEEPSPVEPEEPELAEPELPEEPASVEPDLPAGPASPEGEDPWSTGERVAALSVGRRMVDQGRPLSGAGEQQLRRYVRDHRGDVRAHLLLAAHYVERGFDTSAFERYELALRVDERARYAERTLPDLVRLGMSGSVSEQAGTLIAMTYGRAALTEIDRRLAEDDLDPDDRARLTRVREEVEAMGGP